MCATPVKRKLAAILAADAVGYSRLMAADEEGTLEATFDVQYAGGRFEGAGQLGAQECTLAISRAQ